MLQQVYGEGKICRIEVFVWNKWCPEERADITDKERCNHLTTSKTDSCIEKVTKMVKNDCTLVTKELNMRAKSMSLILTKDFNTICAKMVLKSQW